MASNIEDLGEDFVGNHVDEIWLKHSDNLRELFKKAPHLTGLPFYRNLHEAAVWLSNPEGALKSFSQRSPRELVGGTFADLPSIPSLGVPTDTARQIVELTHKEQRRQSAILKQLGIEKISPKLGERHNPDLFSADITESVSPTILHGHNTVSSVIKPGVSIGGIVKIPARIIKHMEGYDGTSPSPPVEDILEKLSNKDTSFFRTPEGLDLLKKSFSTATSHHSEMAQEFLLDRQFEIFDKLPEVGLGTYTSRVGDPVDLRLHTTSLHDQVSTSNVSRINTLFQDNGEYGFFDITNSTVLRKHSVVYNSPLYGKEHYILKNIETPISPRLVSSIQSTPSLQSTIPEFPIPTTTPEHIQDIKAKEQTVLKEQAERRAEVSQQESLAKEMPEPHIPSVEPPEASTETLTQHLPIEHTPELKPSVEASLEESSSIPKKIKDWYKRAYLESEGVFHSPGFKKRLGIFGGVLGVAALLAYMTPHEKEEDSRAQRELRKGQFAGVLLGWGGGGAHYLKHRSISKAYALHNTLENVGMGAYGLLAGRDTDEKIRLGLINTATGIGVNALAGKIVGKVLGNSDGVVHTVGTALLGFFGNVPASYVAGRIYNNFRGLTSDFETHKESHEESYEDEDGSEQYSHSNNNISHQHTSVGVNRKIPAPVQNKVNSSVRYKDEDTSRRDIDKSMDRKVKYGRAF